MAAPPRGAHCGSGGTRSTGQTGLNRTAPLTPDPDRATVVVEAEVDGGNVLTTATDVVVATVDRTVTTDPAATVELGPGSREDVVVAGSVGGAMTVVVVASLTTRTWAPPHAVAARQSPTITDRVARPNA